MTQPSNTISSAIPQVLECQVCGRSVSQAGKDEFGVARGNTERFRKTLFNLWRCSACDTIHAIDSVDLKDIYKDYPLNKRQLDVFARGTLQNLLRRLIRAGVQKTDSILDYGCGNGIFVRFLQRRGYSRVTGYDPYVKEYTDKPRRRFDCIVANDVLEHCPSPRRLVADCREHLESNGVLYIGTADSGGVEMNDLERHTMRLHLPFHRVIVTEKNLHKLATDSGMQILCSYRRSYMDTWLPFANYRFLDEFSAALGHNMDLALDPAAGKVLLRKPYLLFYAFLGYFCPSAYEPAVILQNNLA